MQNRASGTTETILARFGAWLKAVSEGTQNVVPECVADKLRIIRDVVRREAMFIRDSINGLITGFGDSEAS